MNGEAVQCEDGVVGDKGRARMVGAGVCVRNMRERWPMCQGAGLGRKRVKIMGDGAKTEKRQVSMKSDGYGEREK